MRAMAPLQQHRWGGFFRRSGTMAALRNLPNFPLLKRKTKSEETAVRQPSNPAPLFGSLRHAAPTPTHAHSEIWHSLAAVLFSLAFPRWHKPSASTSRPDHVANKFVPNQALGAGIDRMPAAAIDKLFTPEALDRVSERGLAARHLSTEHGTAHRGVALESQGHMERSERAKDISRAATRRPKSFATPTAIPCRIAAPRATTAPMPLATAASPTAMRTRIGRAIRT